MDVRFARTGDRRYGVFVVREGYPPVQMDPAPSYDAELPHDFVHFVVEQELGLDQGVFGQLAAGGDAGTFRVSTTSTDAREVSRARRKSGRRGARLARDGQSEAERSERLATICHHEWLARSDRPERRRRAREHAAFVCKTRAASSETEVAALSEDAIQRIIARLDRISETWQALEVGASLTLRW